MTGAEAVAVSEANRGSLEAQQKLVQIIEEQLGRGAISSTEHNTEAVYTD